MKIIYNLKKSEFHRKLREIDLCALDLDNCILSGNSRIIFLVKIMESLLKRPTALNIMLIVKIIYRLLLYSIKLVYVRLCQRSSKGTGDLFIKIFKDFPEKNMVSTIKNIDFYYTFDKHASNTLKLLSKKVVTGILTVTALM